MTPRITLARATAYEQHMKTRRPVSVIWIDGNGVRRHEGGFGLPQNAKTLLSGVADYEF